MSQVQVEQKTYQMPPQDGITIAHFLTVADVRRSLRFYRNGLRRSRSEQGRQQRRAGVHQIANTWLLVNPGVVRHLINRR